MADPQFEEFKDIFEKLPQHIKAPSQCYRIAHDIEFVTPVEEKKPCEFAPDEIEQNLLLADQGDDISKEEEDKAILDSYHSDSKRKRRKLPAIPSHRKPLSRLCGESLAKELIETGATPGSAAFFQHLNLYLQIDPTKPCFVKKELASPEHSIDSGHSSSLSPDAPTMPASLSSSTLSSCASGRLQLQDATHRVLYKFLPRHHDEMEADIGDPLYVHKEEDDLWCEGVNLRTGMNGIIPSAYITDVDYKQFDPEGSSTKKERYLIDFLGSVEVSSHKGNDVLCQAVRKVVKARTSEVGVVVPHPSILEITDQGLRMVDRGRPQPNHVPTHDYYFNLKNVTFCGYHPHDHRYFGFITKHPLYQRFACHVFMGQESTRDVAEAVGRAFRRFYHKFIEMVYPTEDIYLE